ncbi:hypothetical protein AB7M74_005227 [Bradyrhizobium japonicum]
MEIGAVLGHLGERVVDLVVDGELLLAAVLQREARARAERHLPVAVEGAAGIDADRERGHLRELLPSAGEEIAGRAFHAWQHLVVPVDAQDRVAKPSARQRHPDLLDRALALNVAERKGRTGLDDDIGRDLPALAEIAGLACGGAVEGHAALALLAGEILGADRARLRIRQARQIAEMQAQSGKRHAVLDPWS